MEAGRRGGVVGGQVYLTGQVVFSVPLPICDKRLLHCRKKVREGEGKSLTVKVLHIVPANYADF